MQIKSSKKIDRFFYWLAWAIIITGTIVRVAVYIQNRNLFIDEANVARNIFERGFIRLAMPLSYEQYAPPIFMWIVKGCTILFGFSEYALRLFPLLSGIGSLIMMFLVLRQLTTYRALWYPLFLMAVAFIFIHYSAELKQYMSDTLITLILIYCALKIDLLKNSKIKFTLIWVVIGSIAIWASMPSVFILTGVGIYYLVIALKNKDKRFVIPVICIALIWIAQFALYYFTVLKSQANSNYLQQYHKDYFLFILPKSRQELMHNWYVFRELLEEAGGYWGWAWRFNIFLFVLGAVLMLWKHREKGLLLIIPVIAVLVAAALHQYSLFPRLGLFMMAIMLIIIGCGLNYLLEIPILIWQLPIIVFAAIIVKKHNMLHMITEPMKGEEITESLTFLKQQNISGNNLYVNNGAVPAFIYYTQINPEKKKWAQFKDAHLLNWNTNYDSLAASVTGKNAFIYTAISKEELDHYKEIISKHLVETARLESETGRKYAYVYQKP